MAYSLSDHELQDRIDLDEFIDAVRTAHRDLAEGTAVQPARHTLAISGSDSLVVPMLAASSRWRICIIKTLVDCPGNAGTSRPVQQSTLQVIDMDTGACEAFLPGRLITRTRTAATSAVATDVLANPSASVLGVIGAGAMARAHLEAIRRVRPITETMVWSRSVERRTAFAAAANEDGYRVTAVTSPRDVVEAADIICTLTPAQHPVVSGSWLRPGQHINAVGAPPRADHREIDSLAVTRSRVVVDTLDTALTESGAILIPLQEGVLDKSQIETDLGAVLLGRKPGRSHESEITLFNSVGLAIQDLAAAACVLGRATPNETGADRLVEPPVDAVAG